MFDYVIRSFSMINDFYCHDANISSFRSFNFVRSRFTGSVRHKKRNMLLVQKRTRAKHRKAK